MKTETLSIFAAVVLFWGCAGTGPTANAWTRDEIPRDRQGDEAVSSAIGNIVLRDVDGKDVAIAQQVAGNVALISFFATYCEPCKRKMVDHQRLHEKCGEKGLAVVAISVDEPETFGQVRPFARSRGLTFPVLLDTDYEAVRQLNPRRTLPYSILVDRTGKTIWTHEGYVPGDHELFERRVVKALDGCTN